MDGTQTNSSTILRKLFNIQKEFKSTKESENKFGGYKYRNVEQMLSKLRPLLDENELVLTFTDSMHDVAGEIVLETVGCLTDINNGDLYTTKSCVVVDKNLKGMCSSQASGASLTYNHKYCLMGLLAINDGSEDLDSMDFNNSQSKPNTPNMIERIDACQTTKELNALYKSLTETEQNKWLNCFSFRKKKLLANKSNN